MSERPFMIFTRKCVSDLNFSIQIKMSWISITLLLSCFLLQAQLDGAEAKSGIGPGDQDWGYVKVRPGAFMFWWLYYANPPMKPANFDVYSKPLLIWLQGGPGASSAAFGNFGEIGPLDVNLERRNHTWVNDYNVLFIDSPVNAGFSFIDDNVPLPRDNRAIAYDLMRCIEGFLKAYTQFQKVPTYIIAESYGGKMATHFALLWDKVQNPTNGAEKFKSNLKGIGLGDPWISPIESILAYAPFLLNTGMVNYNGYEKIQQAANLTKYAINSGNWSNAIEQFKNTWITIINCTNNIDLYNLLEKKTPLRESHLAFSSLAQKTQQNARFDQKLNYLMNGSVRKTLGLIRPFKIRSYDIKHSLREDFLKPVTNIVERILNETNLKIFIYNGQLDVVIPTSSTLAWIEKLHWSGAKNWKKSERIAVTVDNYIEGYVQGSKKLKMFWINRAGHMVPEDNYQATDVMLKMLTNDS